MKRYFLIILFSLSAGLIPLSCGDNPSGPSFFPPDSGGPVGFEIEGNQAIMIGTLDQSTPARVADMIANNPQVDTIVMKGIPGTINSAVSLNAGRLIRSSGLNTVVPADGAIASGGVDIFLAGIVRTVEPGGRVGVHTWESEDGNGDPIIGSELDRNDPLHLPFKNYYREMNIPEDFYWFSINAAGTDEIHWMTDQELQEFNVVQSATTKVRED